jgi:hypothetical protein
MTPQDQARIAWIDQASYIDLLAKWRFARLGDPYFQGEVADHYTAVMRQRRDEVGPQAHTQASKVVGWDSKSTTTRIAIAQEQGYRVTQATVLFEAERAP